MVEQPFFHAGGFQEAPRGSVNVFSVGLVLDLMRLNEPKYPVQFSVDYPDRPLNRISSFFRLIAVIPIGIVAVAVSGGQFGVSGSATSLGLVAAVTAFISAPGIMIFYRRKYPRWWFDWYLALLRFENRVAAFLFLMRDEYPSTKLKSSRG